jgi:nicotinamidase-related amidase
MALKKAVKEAAKLRMAIVGPAGSGKTYTALKLAQGLAGGKPIALFDTEHGSAAKYADAFDFDVDSIAAPFHPDKFCQAIRDAAQGGYSVVVIDSLSHAWNGPGGLLTLVEEATARQSSKNSYTAWKDATPVQDRLVQAIVSAGIHVIVTMRSKTDYVIEQGANGKQAPRKVGMAPIQRDGMDYEFDVVMEMDAANTGIITKTRCSALTDGVFRKPGADVSSILNEWLQGATPEIVTTEPPVISQDGPGDERPPLASAAQRNRLHALGTELYGKDGWNDARHVMVNEITSGATTTSNDLTPNECATLIARIEMEQLGRALYAEQWPQVGRHNAERISNSEISNPHELTTEQINKLIEGMQRLQAKRKYNQELVSASQELVQATVGK